MTNNIVVEAVAAGALLLAPVIAEAEPEVAEKEVDEEEPQEAETVAEATTDSEVYEATFYTAYCSTGCTGVTATGLDVSNTIYTAEGIRVVAVDPSVIPLGSIVRVTHASGGGSTTFKAEAADVGSDIKGRRIDVLVETEEEANRLGRQRVEVEMIRRGSD